MDARQQALFFLKFLRNALQFRYPLSGTAKALYPDDSAGGTSSAGFIRIKDAQKVFTRIIPQSSWTYSLYRLERQRFECLETPDFSYLFTTDLIDRDIFIPDSRSGVKISLRENGGTGTLCLFYREQQPQIGQLPRLLQAERAGHPLNAIHTHDRAWIEDFEKNWWLYKQIPPHILSVTGQKLQNWFLRYFSGEEEKTSNIWTADDMQAFWNEYSLPAYGYLWKRWWQGEESPVFPFILSVMYHNPFWLSGAFSLLKTAAGSEGALVTLLKLIRQKFFVFTAGSRQLFGINPGGAAHIFTVDFPRFKLTGRCNENSALTALEIKAQFSVKIDKTVFLEFYPESNQLFIVPVLPFLSRGAYHTITVDIDGLSVKVPMIWRQFTVHIRGMRLKFLLKGRHWQLTLKWPPGLTKMILEQREILKDTLNNRQKLYLDWVKPDPRAGALFYFDRHGRQLKTMPAENGIVQAAVLDKKGLLVPRGRIKAAAGKKSKSVNFLYPSALPALRGTHYELIIPGSGKIPLAVEDRAEDVIRRLKETPAAILESGLILTAPGAFVDALYAYTALRPLTLSYDAAAGLYGAIKWHIIVSDDIPVDRCREEDGYFFEKKGDCTIIRIKSAWAESFVKRYFNKGAAVSSV